MAMASSLPLRTGGFTTVADKLKVCQKNYLGPLMQCDSRVWQWLQVCTTVITRVTADSYQLDKAFNTTRRYIHWRPFTIRRVIARRIWVAVRWASGSIWMDTFACVCAYIHNNCLWLYVPHLCPYSTPFNHTSSVRWWQGMIRTWLS